MAKVKQYCECGASAMPNLPTGMPATCENCLDEAMAPLIKEQANAEGVVARQVCLRLLRFIIESGQGRGEAFNGLRGQINAFLHYVHGDTECVQSAEYEDAA